MKIFNAFLKPLVLKSLPSWKKPQFLLLPFWFVFAAFAGLITGPNDHGCVEKINRQKVEVKIIQSGDSLTGTSYYESANNYRRYTIKGYLTQTNECRCMVGWPAGGWKIGSVFITTLEKWRCYTGRL